MTLGGGVAHLTPFKLDSNRQIADSRDIGGTSPHHEHKEPTMIAFTITTNAQDVVAARYSTHIVATPAEVASRIEALLPALLPYPSIADAEATAQDVALTFHDALEMVGRYTYRTRSMDDSVTVIHAQVAEEE